MGPMINDGRRRLLRLAAVALAGAAVDSVTAQQTGKGPDYFNPNNFNPTMAIVMVVLVTAFFLLGFFSIYLRRCAAPPLGEPEDDEEYPVGLGPGLGLGHRPGVGVGVRRMRGLDRAVLDSFPTMAYADVRAHRKAGGKGELECAVCLCEFDDDDTLRLLLPRCAHAFHADCIDAWLASHVTCPVCRAVLAPDADAVPATEVVVQPPVVPAAPADQAVVVVDADAAAAGETETEEQRVMREEAAELLRIGSVKRALRSKSSGRRRLGPAQFPRSHTTGHSLAAPPSHSPSSSTLDSDSERYTLRLPDHVLREAVAAGILRRSASVQTGGARRGGFGIARTGRSVRLGNSGWWPNMSLLARTFSARLPVWGSVRRAEPDVPAKFAGDGGKAVEQCDGGACSLGTQV